MIFLLINYRKPKVTRKVIDDENPAQETSQEDDVVDDAMNLAIQVSFDGWKLFNLL